MKALVKKQSGEGLWLEDVPQPGVAANDVLIKVGRTGICGTDLHIYKWDDWASKTVLVPLVVAALGAPGTIPAPFRVALALLLPVQHSDCAPHPHSHGCGPLPAFLALLVRFHCLRSLLKSQRSLLCGAGCSAWPT